MHSLRNFDSLERITRGVRSISARRPSISRTGLIEVYRGLHDTSEINFDRLGQFWSISICEAAKYAVPTDPVFVPREGAFYFGHIIQAKLPLDFENLSCSLAELIKLLRGEKVATRSDKRDLFEVFVPFDQSVLLQDPKVLYSIKTSTSLRDALDTFDLF